MPLQVHPIALGCMLVVAVGTLIYTYMTTRQEEHPYGYGRNRPRSYDDFDEPPSRTISRSSLTDDNRPPPLRRKKQDDCTICLGPMRSGMKTLTCDHVFHVHCITTWLKTNSSCPLCRKEAHI